MSQWFEGRVVVMLGDRVATAFEVRNQPLHFFPLWGALVAVSPHPSGVSRWWNDPRNVEDARRFWTLLVIRPPRVRPR